MGVGLDIGSKTIKAVELVSSGSKYSLRAVGAIGHNTKPVDQLASDKEMAELANVIKKLFTDARINGREVALSIPESKTFTKILKFPLLNEQEIASAVQWGAEEHIPMQLSEAVVEHQILERREAGNPPQVFVLLVAVERKLVEKYVGILDRAGLKTIAVEAEMMSAIRSVVATRETSLVLDMGARSTDVAVTKSGRLYLSRSIATAGDAFTRAIAQTLGISEVQADEYKRNYGLSAKSLEGKVGAALMPIFNVVTEEIKKAVYYYSQNSGGDKPASVILTGGSAGMPDTASTLAKLLGYEVVMGDPFSKVSVDVQSKKSLSGYEPLYPIAAGLAMRGG